MTNNDLNYDVSADGQRFLMIREREDAPPLATLIVVENWHQELLERVPVD